MDRCYQDTAHLDPLTRTTAASLFTLNISANRRSSRGPNTHLEHLPALPPPLRDVPVQAVHVH